VSYQKVKQLYEKLDNENVIKVSDQLLQQGGLSDSLTIDVHIMRANIFYQNGDELSTRKSFESILMIKRNFIPDPSNISPKLISIFNGVKTEYLRNHPEVKQPQDSTQTSQKIKVIDPSTLKRAIVQNILIPGLGQFYIDNNTKGWLTTSVSALSLGGMIYTILDTKNKEDAYLNETNKLLIQQKYDDYNKSYKIRNALIISYVVVWLYSQIDLLFFSNGEQNSNGKLSQLYNFSLTPSSLSALQINFRVPL
jgi:hypothetical protein